MNPISKYFYDKKEAKRLAGESDIAMRELANEALDKRRTEKEAAFNAEIARQTLENMKNLAEANEIASAKLRMESPIPWYELFGASYDIETPPLEPIRERYRWNPAFIKHLRESGITGEHDHEVISAWEHKIERERIKRLIAIEREAKKNSTEPWAEIVSEEFDEDSKQYIIKMDWNDAHIKMLRRNGYAGRDAQEIMDKYLKRLGEEAGMELQTIKHA